MRTCTLQVEGFMEILILRAAILRAMKHQVKVYKLFVTEKYGHHMTKEAVQNLKMLATWLKQINEALR